MTPQRLPLVGHLLPAVLLAVVLLGLQGCCTFSSPHYTGRITDHYDGERFHNQAPGEMRGLGDLAEWSLTRKPEPWPAWKPSAPRPAPPRNVGQGKLRVTFVNHSTLLLQMDGLNILTDPIWSERAGPLSWAGSKRKTPPGIRFEELPPIDVVLISHNHYDHLDVPTLERLVARDHPRILTGLGNAALLEAEGLAGAVELDWWEVEPLIRGSVRVTAVPAQHFSMRGLCDWDTTLWVGFVVESTAGPVYFAGDTAWGPHFAQIREEFGPLRLALLPLGAFLPRWIMAPVHISPEEAVLAHRVLGSAKSFGMHFGTFAQADDGRDTPILHLRDALRAEGIPPSEFEALDFGEGRDIAGLPGYVLDGNQL